MTDTELNEAVSLKAGKAFWGGSYCQSLLGAFELLERIPKTQTVRLVRRRNNTSDPTVWVCEIDKPGLAIDGFRSESDFLPRAICQAYLENPEALCKTS